MAVRKGVGVGKLESQIYCTKYILFYFNVVLWVSQAQAQAALQQQDAQTLQQQKQQQQTLQDHTQAIQYQQIQAALQRQTATLQEMQPQLQQALAKQVSVPKGRRPRGRKTAYGFFVQTSRMEYKKKHPDENIIFAEFSKKCADRWHTMSEKEKARFQEMAKQDKKRYDLEMKSYALATRKPDSE